MENENPSLEGNLGQGQNIKCSVCGLPIDSSYDHGQCQKKEGVELSPDEQAELDEILAKENLWLYIKNINPKFHRLIALKLIEKGLGYYVAKNLEKFQGLDHQEIALKIIETGRGDYVADRLDKFQGLDYRKIALKLIETGRGRDVAAHLDIFEGFGNKELALKLIEEGYCDSVIRRLDKFQGLDKEIALKLIEIDKGQSSFVGGNLDKFQGLDQEVALKLIEKGHGSYVARNLDKFQGLDHQEIALKLIDRSCGGWGGSYVAENLDKFQGLDHQEIALKIIEAGDGSSVAAYLEKFQGLDHQEIALKIALNLINRNFDLKYVAENLDKFQGLDHHEIVLKLIEAGLGYHVARGLDKFQGLDQEVALKLIEAGRVDDVVRNLGKFQGLGHQVALKLIETGRGDDVRSNLKKFQGLGREIALNMIEKGHDYDVIGNLDKFQGLDKEVALKLIEAGLGGSVVGNLDKFQGLDQEVALKLIEKGDGSYVARNLDKFQGLDHREIALKLIEKGQGEIVAKNLDKFQGLDHREIALKLIEARDGSSIAGYLDKFQGLDHQEIALTLIEAWLGGSVVGNLDKFQGLDHRELAMKLIEKGQGEIVAKNLDKFQGLDHREIALELIHNIRSSLLINNLEKFQGLDHREIVSEITNTGYLYLVAYNLDKFQGLDHREIACKLIGEGKVDIVANDLDKFEGLEGGINERELDMMGTLFKGLCSNFGLFTFSEILTFTEKNKNYFIYLSNTPEESPLLKKEDLPYLNELRITWTEAEILKRAGVSLNQTLNYDQVFEVLRSNAPEWQDEQNIIKPFEAGQEIFGAERMFVYLYREDFTLHDGLHAFLDIIELQKISGLSPDQFYNNILAQVNKDGSTYEAGISIHHLNQIAQTLDRDIEKALNQAKKYEGVARLRELASSLDSPQAIFSSWNNLKRFSELQQLLGRTEILDELKELREQGKDKLYEYVETLAFHPSSKVDMDKVFEFWRNPAGFLSQGDAHTPEDIHNRKKPSNYVEIPNLDLTAEELRDALVEGDLDSLQAFTPMEIEYRIKTKEGDPRSLRERIRVALGSHKEKIKGEAKDPKKLFHELQVLFKKNNLTLQEYLSGTDLPYELKDQIEEEVENWLSDTNIGLSQVDSGEIVFVAKINKKSDPNGVLAGNDTSCCMPFGSGKNTVYTFNPDTSLFTLQIKRPDGTLRTIAQSVLTKDRDVKRLVPDILAGMNRAGEKIDQLVPEEAFIESPAFLACDNVEVAPNFSQEKYPKIIESIYRDFFSEYMERHAEEQGLTKDVLVIGQGYSDSLTHLPVKPNTFVPLAPVGYSDKTQEEVYVLDLTKEGKEKLSKRIKETTIERKPQSELPNIRGLNFLTFQDTLAVAYLEGKAYSDNESLLVYLHNIENGLIAKDINNVAKGRQNMCLKFVDSEGKIRSYIIAYEGKTDEDEEDEERIIYIEDFASDRESPLASGKVLKGFIELYRKNYLEKGDLVPIFTQAREQTSYRLLKKHIEKIAQDLDLEIEVEELSTYLSGDDTMHPVMIRPKTKNLS